MASGGGVLGSVGSTGGGVYSSGVGLVSCIPPGLGLTSGVADWEAENTVESLLPSLLSSLSVLGRSIGLSSGSAEYFLVGSGNLAMIN